MNTQRNKNEKKHVETKPTVVNHEDLLKACINDHLAEVTYGAPTYLVISSEWQVCVTCSIKDLSNGRMMSAIGCASPSTMQTAEQKRDPIQTARIRAFDHAMMLLLGMDESAVSDWDFINVIDDDTGQNPKTTFEGDLERTDGLTTPTTSTETVPVVTQTLLTGVTAGSKDQSNASDKRKLFEDNEIMLIGDGLIGYTYDVVKNFRLKYLMSFLEYLSKTPGIHYDDEAKQNQLQKMYEAARRLTIPQQKLN